MAVEVIPVGLIETKLDGKIQRHMDVAGMTVEEFLSQLPIQPALVAFTVVNGQLVPRSHRLVDGDVIKLVPMLGGG